MEAFMSHELEQDANGIASIAFDATDGDLWHRLGYGIVGLMTTDQALQAAHMDRHLRILPVPVPEGTHWSIPQQYMVVLEGGVFQDGAMFEDKVVGMGGEGFADAHRTFSMRDRLELAEFTLKASEGQATWSSVGLLRDARQGFACLALPDTVIDPNGIADRISNYATVVWSFDSSLKTLLSDSNVRVVCANTMAAHLGSDQKIIEVKHTSATAKDRFAQAAKHWAIAQNKAKAMEILANRLLAVRGRKMDLVRNVADAVIGKKPERESAEKPGRKLTSYNNKLNELEVLSFSPTNDVGENGWAAYNVITEWLDWQSPIKCDGQDEAVCRFEDQFDGKNDAVKLAVADRLLALT
jgi:hypothetical protein